MRARPDSEPRMRHCRNKCNPVPTQAHFWRCEGQGGAAWVISVIVEYESHIKKKTACLQPAGACRTRSRGLPIGRAWRAIGAVHPRQWAEVPHARAESERACAAPLAIRRGP